MNTIQIACGQCGRTWSLQVGLEDTTLLQMELMSRPCPNCEACTLVVTTGQSDSHRSLYFRKKHPVPRRV